MKGFVVGLIVLGGIALVGGAAVLAYGIHKGKINDGFVTNEYVLEEDADNISIDVSTANVHFEKAEDDKIKVDYTKKEKVYHSVSVSNKLLTIKQIDERKWYQKYLFNFNWRSMDIAVYLPETDYSDVTIDTNTGNISIPKDFTFANMTLESDTGNMTINSKASGDIDIKVHTGNVRLTDVDGNEEFDEEILHMRQLLKTKLVDMDLSVRALNCLKAADVDTLGDLVQYNKTDLLKFRNFGKKSLTELDDLLESLNLSFGTDISKYKLDKD